MSKDTAYFFVDESGDTSFLIEKDKMLLEKRVAQEF